MQGAPLPHKLAGGMLLTGSLRCGCAHRAKYMQVALLLHELICSSMSLTGGRWWCGCEPRVGVGVGLQKHRARLWLCHTCVPAHARLLGAF